MFSFKTASGVKLAFNVATFELMSKKNRILFQNEKTSDKTCILLDLNVSKSLHGLNMLNMFLWECVKVCECLFLEKIKRICGIILYDVVQGK